MKNVTIKSALYLVLSLVAGTALAADPTPDLAKEKRWAEQIVPQLIVGEDITLKAGNTHFLGLYTQAETDTAKGATILIHGGGVHPDWSQIIKPLRVNLPEDGWATLSIQMPVLHNDATEEEYVPLFSKHTSTRIKAAVDYLASQGIDNIFIAAHSLGATMASDYLARSHDKRVKGFVGIGMKGEPRKDYPQLDNVYSLVQVRQPVLDIYGSETNKGVRNSVERRAYTLATIGNRKSRQVVVNGSDHFFEGYEEKLQHEITAFMDDVSK